jgi:hypothetical protein
MEVWNNSLMEVMEGLAGPRTSGLSYGAPKARDASCVALGCLQREISCSLSLLEFLLAADKPRESRVKNRTFHAPNVTPTLGIMSNNLRLTARSLLV